MHANRNKNAVKRVGKGMMKANRTRNLFAVSAIVLTTFMITTVFALGINYMENVELMQARTAGTTANVSLAMPTAGQEQLIRNLDYVRTVGVQYMVGSVSERNDEGRELSIALWHYDTTEWEKHYKKAISGLNGRYPAQENEIMLSEDALSQLGIQEPVLDMEIPLSYYDKNGWQQRTFLLSGWFHSYTGAGIGFVSEDYCDNAGYTAQDDGILSISLTEMPDDFFRIQRDVALNENQSFKGAVSLSSWDGSVIALVILLVLFIIGSGYLLIYNILYISVSKDTRFYGLIKTLGTTQKQIRSLVKRQAVRFACIGIPIGILSATAVSLCLVPFFLREGFKHGKSVMDAEVFFHPSIYALSIIFSAVTVWISCNTPAKAAAKIPPVEALKYQGFSPKKAKHRNSTKGGKLRSMAFHNVFRDKKRVILVFMSLFMGIALILGVNGFLDSIQVERYIENYMDYTFEYTDTQFTQYEQQNKEVSQFDGHLVEQISQIDGIETIDVVKTVWAAIDFDEAVLTDFMRIKYEDSSYRAEGKSYGQMVLELRDHASLGTYGCYITTLDESVVEEYNHTHDVPIDMDAFKNGELAIAGLDWKLYAPNAALIGKTLTLTVDSPDGKAAEFLIGGAFDYEEVSRAIKNIGSRQGSEIVPNAIFVSKAGMERLTQMPIISFIGVRMTNLDHLYEIDERLQEVNQTLTATEWEYGSAVSVMEYLNQYLYAVELVGNGISMLFIMTGLVNFVNVMLTGVIARKNEFAIMESIGTTKKQIRNMLIMEGGVYAVISTLLVMTFGNAFLSLVARAVPHIVDYARFEYPVSLVACLIAAIFAIDLSVPAFVYRAVSKETVIGRMRSFDN